MRFGYIKDPLFVVCFSAYWTNTYLEKLDLSPGLLRSYLNDLICIPFWIPIMLWGERQLGLRRHDDPPHAFEVIIPLLIWSFVFEVVLPRLPVWTGKAVADPIDVFCYVVGAFMSVAFWGWWYRRRFNGLIAETL